MDHDPRHIDAEGSRLKLRDQILAVASAPKRLPIGPADDAGWFDVGARCRVPPWQANTVTVTEIATAICGAPRRADPRRHHSVTSSVSRAIAGMVKDGLLEYSLEYSRRPYLRITAAGRALLTSAPTSGVVNIASPEGT